jgi:hypothetical protein
MLPGIESSKNFRYLMQSMQMADPDLPVAGESPVLDWLPEARGRLLQDLLQVLRKGHVIEEEDRSRFDGVVVEGLVKDRSLQLKLLGKEVEHRPAGIGLPFPGVPRDGNMEALGVHDRLRGDREHEALSHDPVAHMVPVEDIEKERDRITGAQDLGLRSF